MRTLVRLPLRVARRIKRMVFGSSAPTDAASTWPVDPPVEAVSPPAEPAPEPMAPVATPDPVATETPVAEVAAAEPKKRAKKVKEPGEEKPKSRAKKKADAAPEPATPAVQVRAEPTPNPNAMKFVVSKPVVERGSVSFNNATVAAGHPLGEALFAGPGVRLVFAVHDVVTITQEEAVAWDGLIPAVQSAIGKVLGG